ncbi:TPA: gluconate 2-dehydrogenase subunit 3 family protein [Campylobacter jejuni]|nr:gluconate 2-dehydrogenase subunit 3 family protein [Campylobacter jejuni]
MKASNFFTELRSMTIAGVYANPIYGGKQICKLGA